MDKARKGYEWWDRLCKLPKYSFIIGLQGGVRRVEDGGGKWIDYASAQAVLDDAQAEINGLRDRLERLAPAAAPQPPSASGEREAFVKWLSGTYPDIYPVEDAERRWSQEHISALAWEARAALAPSPGIDAAGQKPVGYLMPSGAFIHLEDSDERTTTNGRPMTFMDAAPPAAQPSAEWLAEAERLVDFYAESFSKPTDSGKCRQRLAALLAHLRTKL